MKYNKIIIISMILVIIMSCVAFAQTNDELATVLEDQYKEKIEYANERIKHLENTDGLEITINNAYYQYNYDETDITKGFKEHISESNDKNYWVVNTEKGVRTFTEYGGILQESTSYDFGDFKDKDGNIICEDRTFKGFSQYAKSKFEGEISSLIIVRRMYTWYIYFESEGKEYAIPLSIVSVEGLENGVVYDAETAKELYDKTLMISDEPIGEGSGGNKEPIEIIDEENQQLEEVISDDVIQPEQSSTVEQPEIQEDTAKLQADEDTEKGKLDSQLLTIIILSVLVVGAVIITVVSVSKHKKR